MCKDNSHHVSHQDVTIDLLNTFPSELSQVPLNNKITQEREGINNNIVLVLMKKDEVSASEGDISKSFLNVESQMYCRSDRLADKEKGK